MDMDGCFECRVTAILVDEGDSDRSVFGSRVALLGNGGIAVAWLSSEDHQDPADIHVNLKIYDREGSVAVDSVSVSDKAWALSIAAGGVEEVVLIWSRPFEGIYEGRVYDSDGNARTGVFILNPSSNAEYADVAMAPDGSFMTVWSKHTDFFNDTVIYARGFESTGVPSSDPIRINEITSSSYGSNAVSVDMDDEGEAVVVWSINRSSGSFNQGVRLSTTGETIEENINIEWGDSYPTLAVAPDGSFAIGSSFLDADGLAPFVRVYDSQGLAVAPAFEIESDIYGRETYSRFVALNGDKQVVVFSGPVEVQTEPVHVGRRFDFEGIQVGEEFVYAESTQTESVKGTDMDMSTTGDFVVSWDLGTAEGQGGHLPSAVYLQRFTSDGEQLGSNNWPP